MNVLDIGISVTVILLIVLLVIPWVYPMVTDILKLLDYTLRKAKISDNKFFKFWSYLTMTTFMLLIVLLLCKIASSIFNI